MPGVPEVWGFVAGMPDIPDTPGIPDPEIAP
jgi:hypothetical protein